MKHVLFFFCEAALCAIASAAEPVSVRFVTSLDQVRLGAPVELRIETGEKVDNIKWFVRPSRMPIRLSDDRKECWFTDPTPGVYTFTCAVSGIVDGKSQLDIAEWDVTITPPSGEVMQPIAPPETPQQQADKASENLKKEIQGYAAKVPSPNRKAEAAVLAGTFQAQANRFTIGAAPAGADFLGEAHAAAQIALGTSIVPWEVFFQSLRLLWDDATESGVLKTAKDEGNLGAIVARALESVP